MKKLNKSASIKQKLSLSFLGLFLLIPQIAAAQTAWNMPQFDQKIQIGKDASVTVKETITADFTNQPHHGIYRYVPVQYLDRLNNNLNLHYQVLSITDQSGKAYEFKQSEDGANLFLKIGSADFTISKPTTYVITYRFNRILTQFPDHDELYWNVTGNDGQVDILNSQVELTLPQDVPTAQLQAACYTGILGSTEKNCTAKIINGTTIRYQTTETIRPGEGFTIVVGFPKNIVTFPTPLQQALWFLQDNWGYLIPLFTFAILFYLWYTRGRDPRATRTAIMPEYEAPENLTPAEVGTLIDESVDMRDITSTIIDLAVKGYLIIEETKTKNFFGEKVEYTLVKKSTGGVAPLKEHEQILYDGIFGAQGVIGKKVKLSDLENEFYSKIPLIQNALYKNLTSEGYFASDPQKVRNFYIAGGFILLFINLFALGSFLNLGILIGIIFSCILIFIFAKFMPRRSQKGANILRRIYGLEEFIKTAERDRLKFQEKENIFEKILPYAIALNLANKWTKACEGIYKTPPSWYRSSDPMFMNNFSTYYFLNSLNHLNSNISTSLNSRPRTSSSSGGSGFSSGGGSSGGGFGGGGSGGW